MKTNKAILANKRPWKVYIYTKLEASVVAHTFNSNTRFIKTGFLYSLGCPEIRSVDQAGLKLRDSPASASQLLGLKECTIKAWLKIVCFYNCVCTFTQGPKGIHGLLELE